MSKAKKSADSNLITSALECGLNHEELASLIGVSKEHIKRMQNREISLPLACALKLVIENQKLKESNKELIKEVEILRSLIKS